MNELERFQHSLRAVLDGCTLEPERARTLLRSILEALREEGFLK